jgi:transcriptional regulator with XRE-family HTH domain
MRSRTFFTREMGLRLRKIRTDRGLTLDGVAAGMGLTGKGRWNQVARLEQGKNPDPRLSTVTLYLRACGAQFPEFYDTLTRIERAPADTGPIEQSPMKREPRATLRRRVKREAAGGQDETSRRKRGRTITPEKQKPATKSADHRAQAAVIEQEVKKLLGTENVEFVEMPGYLTIARRTLGELRREGGPGSGSKPDSVADYVRQNRLNPGVAERIRQLVIEQCRR